MYISQILKIVRGIPEEICKIGQKEDCLDREGAGLLEVCICLPCVFELFKCSTYYPG